MRKYLELGRWDVEKEDKHEKGTEPILLPSFFSKFFAFRNDRWEWVIGGEWGIRRVVWHSAMVFNIN
jgi:hypothetical protein